MTRASGWRVVQPGVDERRPHRQLGALMSRALLFFRLASRFGRGATESADSLSDGEAGVVQPDRQPECILTRG